MRLKGVLILSAVGGLIVLALAFAFSLYDFVGGASAGGSPQPRAARDLNFSDSGAASGSDVAVSDGRGPSFQATVASASIYPTPLGSATCHVKQGRVKPGTDVVVKVKVRDTNGHPVSGAEVDFSISESGVSGSAIASPAFSLVNGIAGTVVAVGNLTGNQGSVAITAEASAGDNAVSCAATIRTVR